MFQNNLIAGASGQGGFYPYQIEQSLRFNDDDSAYLSRTFPSAGNRKTWTWSGWVKRGNLTGARMGVFTSTDAGGASYTGLEIDPTNGLRVYDNNSGGEFLTSAVFRDTSSWYHILWAVDTTQATSTDRLKIYVNGVQIASFVSITYPTLNADTRVNIAAQHSIGSWNPTIAHPFDGYMAEVNFIDGTALDPTSFGETKSGIWVPKAYSGSYGTNGFYLSFADSAAIGDDLSGNANDWTANNLVSADVLLDSPTQNWAVLNSTIRQYSAVDFTSDGNLKYQVGANGGATDVIFATIPMPSGKWYCEVLINATATGQWIGVSSNITAAGLGTFGAGVRNPGYAYRVSSGNKCNNDNVGVAYGTSSTVNDIIGIAMDADAGSIEFFKNGVSLGVAFTGMTNAGGGWLFGADSDPNGSFTFNFGQSAFTYTPPTDFLPLNTANLPDPVIDPAQDDVPADYFNTALYTGTGATQSITGVGFQPDWVWFKRRGAVENHWLTDAVRGSTKGLFSNLTDAEATRTDQLTSFDADGFSLGADAAGYTNISGQSYVAWNWLAGNGTASNTSGSITSTVSVNQKAGFSVVGYTGNGSLQQTVGHGLGAAPKMVIVKNRDESDATFDHWWVYHSGTSNPPNRALKLSGTDAEISSTVYWWNNPTDTVFGLANTSDARYTNDNTRDYIAYCFAEVEGYSKIGSYTGNGSTDGPFVYCGFRPAWVLVKRTDAVENWHLLDEKRDPFNFMDNELYANLSNAEGVIGSDRIDFVSNGIKVRTSNGGYNASGGTYIFACFAEQPFKFSNAR